MQVLVSPSDGSRRPAGDPPPGNVHPGDFYDFYRPAEPRAELLRLNMVASLDGSVTDAEGRSGGLGGEADLRAFRALRALSDAVLVGAGTVRTERYGPHRVHSSVADRRRADGRPAPAAVVVVSNSQDLDPSWDLFRQARTRTVVLTCAAAPAERRTALEEVAEVVVTGGDTVDLAVGLVRLRERGYTSVLCEGGPRLNATLLRAGLVDELCLTLSADILFSHGPRLVDAPPGPAGTAPSPGVRLALHGLARDADALFTRYRVRT